MTDSLQHSTHLLQGLTEQRELVFEALEVGVTQGADAGLQKKFCQGTVQIGTARANDLVLTDAAVSRFHLQIDAGRHGFTLSDLASTNGTFLGGHRVRVVELAHEMRIRVGASELLLRPLGQHTSVPLPARDRMDDLVGASAAMRQLYLTLERIAGGEMPVIIEGETGTGKELVASVIHRHSARAEKPFEILDCGALPANLVESELFGHVKGAFTSAARDHRGIFERADGGTVFLDEIGEMKLDVQPALLRVLESGDLRRVGDDRRLHVDVRVVAATHRSLRDMVNKGQFREDLYYRLAGCKVTLPSLREHPEDIPQLVNHFLERLRTRTPSAPATLDPEVMESFVSLPWPGNVRQLRNAVERTVTMGAVEITGQHSVSDGSDFPFGDPSRLPLKEARDVFEKRYLEALLKRCRGDLKRAAVEAQMHPKSLVRLLRARDLEQPK